MHGLNCTHVRTEAVWDAAEKRAPREVTVEVFSCIGNEPLLVYAWEEKTPDGGCRIVAVLGSSRVRSAQDAVRAGLQ